MQFSKAQAMVAIGIVVVILVVVLGLLGIIPGIRKSTTGDPNYPTGDIALVMWGMGDSQGSFSQIIKAYQDLHTNVRIEYRQFSSWDQYEEELVNALAEGRGPDVFMVHNSWADKHAGKLYPAPDSMLSARFVQSAYPEVVYQDFVRQEKVWAVPLYLDSLVLLYNKDIFDANAIAFPPAGWEQLLDTVLATRQMEGNTITVAGTALGGARNVRNMADIISALMLQAGSTINKDGTTQVEFNQSARGAMEFYLQFSNAISPYYTWNESMPNSLNQFIAGKVAMVLDYREAIAIIKEQNPFLNIGVASLPQINQYQPVTVADYKGLAVSRQAGSVKAYVGWDLLRTIATNPQLHKTYLDATGRLSPLRSEIQKELGGDNDVFARAFFITDSWRKNNWNGIVNALQTVVESVRSGRADIGSALKAAEVEINAL